MIETKEIGEIGGYYGGLSVKAEDGKFWWSILDHNGDIWEEIPESLYRELIAFENGREAVADK